MAGSELLRPARELPGSDRLWRWLGVLPVLFYLAHPFRHHVLWGNPWDALWVCYVANLVLAAGLLLRSPSLASTALLWLLLGNGMWLLHLSGGGAFLPSELLPHAGGMTMAVLAVGRLGYARGAWFRAMAGLAGLQLLCRWLTPVEPNVNLSHRVWTGWETLFPSYAWYLVLIWLLVLVEFAGAEMLLRRLWRTP